MIIELPGVLFFFHTGFRNLRFVFTALHTKWWVFSDITMTAGYVTIVVATCQMKMKYTVSAYGLGYTLEIYIYIYSHIASFLLLDQ